MFWAIVVGTRAQQGGQGTAAMQGMVNRLAHK